MQHVETTGDEYLVSGDSWVSAQPKSNAADQCRDDGYGSDMVGIMSLPGHAQGHLQAI